MQADKITGLQRRSISPMIDAAAGDYSSHLIEQQVTATGEWQ